MCDNTSEFVPIVRFVGFVQDMFDPEYYSSKVNGVHTKFRDFCYSSTTSSNTNGINTNHHVEEEMNLGYNLEERHPLFLVPIPFSNNWFRNIVMPAVRDRTKSQDEVQTNQLIYQQEKKKRICTQMYDEVEDINCFNLKENQFNKTARIGSDEDEPTSSCLNFTDSSEVEEQKMNIDWWPKGHMGSDLSQCPILAKLYYDDDISDKDHLKLNDLVEVVGHLCIDPLGADFSNQIRSQQTSNNDKTKDGVFQETDSPLFLDQLVFPPPSLLSRLHVLHYKKLSMNNIAKKVTSPELENPMNNDVDDRELTIKIFAQNIFDGNVVAAEALLMVMMSMAEKSDKQRKSLPSGNALGCASLNIVCADKECCKNITVRLSEIFETLLPISTGVELENPIYPIKSPMKNLLGRLNTTQMQLPQGSCFLVNVGGLTEGSLNENGQKSLVSMSKMSQNFVIPYQFDGMINYNFESDYRIVVVSCSNSMTLLPCTLKIKLNATKKCKVNDKESLVPADVTARIRDYFSRCREISQKIPEEVLRQAQKDFIQRRKTSRNKKNRKGMDLTNNHNDEIGEEEFHRWLTITRLQARSRLGLVMIDGDMNNMNGVAHAEDWEKALSLDDRMLESLL